MGWWIVWIGRFDGLINWWIGWLIDLLVAGLMDWWIGELMDWWIGGLMTSLFFLQQEDGCLRLEMQREGLELQGLQSLDIPWTHERAAMQQEVRLFRRNTIIFYMKLRAILTNWRLGRKDDSADKTAHSEVRCVPPSQRFFQTLFIILTCDGFKLQMLNQNVCFFRFSSAWHVWK